MSQGMERNSLSGVRDTFIQLEFFYRERKELAQLLHGVLGFAPKQRFIRRPGVNSAKICFMGSVMKMGRDSRFLLSCTKMIPFV